MSKTTYTILGFVAIVIWSTSPACAKVLGGALGGFSAAAAVNLIGCVLVFLKQRFIDGRVTLLREASRKYWLVCGGLFVAFQALSFLSMSVIKDDQVVVTCILIRFLWPLLALIFTIPILKAHASKGLILGCLISFVGIVLSQLSSFSLADITSAFGYVSNNVLAYTLCLVMAVVWALFTNLDSKLTPRTGVDGMAVFMGASFVVLAIGAYIAGERPVFTHDLLLPMAYQGIVIGFIANVFWDRALVKGDAVKVILASNFLPPISAFTTHLILGVGVPTNALVGALLVVVGTMYSKRCIEN